MNLNELKTVLSDVHFDVLQDGEFNTLGMATSIYKDTCKVLSFLENEKYTDALLDNKRIKAVIISPQTQHAFLDKAELGLILSDNPKKLFYHIHNYLADTSFYWEETEIQIDPSATISPHAILPSHSLSIGKGTVIEANVVIHPGVHIGNHVFIGSGSQIGSNGFQFMEDQGTMISVKSAGTVLIGDHVDVQHLTCIDRGVFGGPTILRDNCKVDNLVHVAHDVDIGERTLIVAGVSLGGRTVIGHDSWIGINATISNGLTIGNHAYVSLGSVVTRNVADHERVTGNFAIPHERFMANLKQIR